MPREGEGLAVPPRPYSMIALRLGRRLTENQGSGNTLRWGSFGTLARRLLDSMRSCRLALGFVSLRGFGVLLMQRHHFRRKLGSFRINLFRRVDGVRSSRSRLSIFESLGSFVAFSPRDPAAVGFVRPIFESRSTRQLGSFGAAHNADPARVFSLALLSQNLPLRAARINKHGPMVRVAFLG
jgi:hypothetical protein